MYSGTTSPSSPCVHACQVLSHVCVFAGRSAWPALRSVTKAAVSAPPRAPSPSKQPASAQHQCRGWQLLCGSCSCGRLLALAQISKVLHQGDSRCICLAMRVLGAWQVPCGCKPVDPGPDIASVGPCTHDLADVRNFDARRRGGLQKDHREAPRRPADVHLHVRAARRPLRLPHPDAEDQQARTRFAFPVPGAASFLQPRLCASARQPLEHLGAKLGLF